MPHPPTMAKIISNRPIQRSKEKCEKYALNRSLARTIKKICIQKIVRECRPKDTRTRPRKVFSKNLAPHKTTKLPKQPKIKKIKTEVPYIRTERFMSPPNQM